ncbi:hypothetical protein BZ13_843 [Francisella philomiragia subsp. philomiragia ATCC 25015]|nr:hypothetical protein BZ13_843 [Francisella philomiragia subsp. philomiragia ATCC 25015]
MKIFDLVNIFRAFLPHKTMISIEEIEAGHINDTFFHIYRQ